MKRYAVLLALLLPACKHEDRDIDINVTLGCTQDAIDVDTPRPLVLTDDDGDTKAVPPGHSHYPRECMPMSHPKKKAYRLVDGDQTVARCEL